MRKIKLAAVVSGVLGLYGPAQADQILLSNGDRISGTITEVTGDTIKIKTDYAGALTLKTDVVKSFQTDTPAHWQINLKERQAIIHSSNKKGHVSVNGKTVAISELTLVAAPNAWKKSGLLETSLDVDNDQNRKEKLHVNTELNLESKRWRHALKAESKRDKEHDRVTEDTLELNHTTDYLFDSHWLARADSTYREEGVDTLSKYWYIGLGPGYRLWGEDKDKLDLIFAYNRFWFRTGQARLELSAWASALDYKQFWLQDKLETFIDIRLAFPTIDAIDSIANTSSGLRYYFQHNIHLSVKYDYNETRYQLGTIKDSSYTLGAGVNF